MKLFIVLACILVITAAVSGKKAKEGNGGEKSSKNPICKKRLPVKPNDCCPNMPSFKQFFDTCVAQCNATTTTAEPTTSASTGSGKHGKREGHGKHGKGSGKGQLFKCVMPCVLNAAQVLGADGNISVAALNNALLQNASADWKLIVPNVTSICIVNGK